MNLRVRLALIVGLIVAAGVVGAAWSASLLMENQLRGQVDQFLVARLSPVLRAGAGDPDGGLGLDRGGRGGRESGSLTEYDAVTQLVDVSGGVRSTIGGDPLPVDATDLALARDGGSLRLRTVTVNGTDFRVATVPVAGRNEIIQVGRDLTETEHLVSGARSRMLAIGIIGAGIAAVVGWLVARRIAAPVQRLTAATEHIAATGDLTTAIDVEGRDEVGRLAKSFTSMLRALDESKNQQRRLVQDASHELRTPLTSLRANIEFLGRSGDQITPAARTEILGDLRLEAEELSALAAELVELATDQTTAEEPSPVELALVAREVTDRARRRTNRDVNLDIETAGAATVFVRRGQLERALTNLVDNAIKFSPAPSPVEVRVRGAVTEVRDHGPGIAEADRSQVFDRFYRATAARTLPGSGLGLAIVKQFADDHHGRVWAANGEHCGAVVGIDLTSSQVAEVPGTAD